MKIKKLEDKNDNLELCFLSGVSMPNGEFITNGKSIGFIGNENVYIIDKD